MSYIYSKFAGEEHWHELLEELIEDLPERITALNKAIAAKDFQSLSVLVHQLKGACGSYGFDEITPLAERLEKALNSESERYPFPAELAIFLDALQRMTYLRAPHATDSVV